jgi:hypothetical protein
VVLPAVEDGSRLAPMHRFHDPTVLDCHFAAVAADKINALLLL